MAASQEQAKVRVFISYAWEDGPDGPYRELVARLASRLRSNGVNVRLDRWHVEGATIPSFMNRELRLAEKVLILCSPRYREKVHRGEEGPAVTGVDWESTLLTAALFRRTKTRQQVVVALFKGTWDRSAPDYLASVDYVDLTDPTKFEARYRDLLRRLTDRTEAAPVVGNVPDDLEPPPVPALTADHLRSTLTHQALLPEGDGARKSERLAVSALPVPQFHYGGVVPPDFFIDRQEHLQDAEQIIRSGQNLLLVGERRAGKTSFCEMLIHRLMTHERKDLLVGKLNLESCENLTIATFLGHTLLNMIGEISRQVFGCRYSDLLSVDSPRTRELEHDRGFQAVRQIHRLATMKVRSKVQSTKSLVAQEFIRFASELLDVIRGRGWGRYVLIYDEANRLATDLSVKLLMNNIEVLNTANLTTVYAASPAMEASFEPLSRHIDRKLRLGPFDSRTHLRRLLERYLSTHSDQNANSLPITTSAEELVWEYSNGMPFRIQCLLAYSFMIASRDAATMVDAEHVERALSQLSIDQPEYFEGRSAGRRP